MATSTEAKAFMQALVPRGSGVDNLSTTDSDMDSPPESGTGATADSTNTNSGAGTGTSDNKTPDFKTAKKDKLRGKITNCPEFPGHAVSGACGSIYVVERNGYIN